MYVELKKWTFDDMDSLIKLCNNADRKYLGDRLPSLYTEDSAQWWLNMAAEHDGMDAVYRAVWVDGKIVGNISVEQKSDVYRMDAEIGYLLRTENWSKGIMTEAVRQICEIAFEELDIIRISGLVYEPNMASRKVLEKNGFLLEGVMKNAVVKQEKLYDLCIYGKLKQK